MTKDEFNKACTNYEVLMNLDAIAPTDEQYKIIEHVYEWHPAISNTRGKQQIAMIYVEFGFRFISQEMEPTAVYFEGRDKEYQHLLDEMDKISKEIDEWNWR